ncbi:MAG: VOC family protein [Rubrivivax sp.]
MNGSVEREAQVEGGNPLGLEGIEYVEYQTAHPQALGHVLELMGFRPVARHRSREVLLYRQGEMNVIVNAHASVSGGLPEHPRLAALALRVRDAGAAHGRLLELGAWDVPVRVQPMELHIPAIHGVGTTRLYFVDRWREFSIYNVDFVPVPGVDSRPPALAGLHWFGVVQYVGLERTEDWVEFYRSMFGFQVLGQERETGVLPSGCVLRSPDGSLHLQLVEPASDMVDGEEWLQRVAFGAADVPAAAAALAARGVQFVDTARVHVEVRGALTQSWLGGLMFELIHHAG